MHFQKNNTFTRHWPSNKVTANQTSYYECKYFDLHCLTRLPWRSAFTHIVAIGNNTNVNAFFFIPITKISYILVAMQPMLLLGHIWLLLSNPLWFIISHTFSYLHLVTVKLLTYNIRRPTSAAVSYHVAVFLSTSS